MPLRYTLATSWPLRCAIVVCAFTLQASRLSADDSRRDQVLRAAAKARQKIDIDLTDKTFSPWQKHIEPNKKESAWKQIPWLGSFREGLMASEARKKPMLLWTMNGHPLGCT